MEVTEYRTAASTYHGSSARRRAQPDSRDFRFHDLRHHGATMALNAGFKAPVVMALGGWKSEAMMRRYAAVTDDTLRAAAEAVSGVGIGSGKWQQRAKSASTRSRHAPSQG